MNPDGVHPPAARQSTDSEAAVPTAGSASAPFRQLMSEIGKVLVGQDVLVHRMLVGLLTGGHLLIEGVPGLAKTTAVSCLAQAIQTDFQRLQFTPDLLPA
ncbi:MAG: MoxR family ATPase, partial [Planctomycetota bacterium]